MKTENLAPFFKRTLLNPWHRLVMAFVLGYAWHLAVDAQAAELQDVGPTSLQPAQPNGSVSANDSL